VSRPLLLVCATGFLLMLGLGVLFPVLGFFTRDLGLSDFQAGILISSYAFASFAAAPLWGRFSDRYGRRPSILIGLLGFSLTFGLFALGSSFGELLAARFFGGLLAAAAMPSVMAYAADSSDPSQRSRAIGMVGASFGLGVVAGPAIGAFVADAWGLRAPFWLASGIGLFSAAAVWALLPESLTPALREAAPSRRRELAARGMTRARMVGVLSPYLAFSFLMQTSRMALEGTIAFLVADRLRGDVRDVGLLLVAAGLAAAAVQGGGIRALTRLYSDRSIMVAGSLMACVGVAALAIPGGWLMLTGSVLVLAVGSALQLPTFTAELSRQAESIQGEAQGLNTSAQSLGRVVGPLLFTALYQATGTVLPYLIAAGLVVAALAIVRARMPVQASPAEAA
jgi:multidrug resistance protein